MNRMFNRLINGVVALASVKALVVAAVILGAIAVYVGCRMAYKFGITISPEHATFLVIVSLAGAILLPAADIFKLMDMRNTAVAITAIAVGFLVVEFYSHVGYTVGQRHGNVVGAKVQHTRYVDNRDSVAQALRDVKSAEARLAQLQWVGVVTHVGIRGQIDTQTEAIRQEEKRGGCGPKCLALKQQMAKLQEKLGAAEERDTLNKKLAATKAWLEGAKAKAAATDVGDSSVLEQAMLPAKLWAMSLNPDETAVGWSQIIIGIMMALAATALGPTLWKVAFGLVQLYITPDELPKRREPIIREPTPRPVPRETNQAPTMNETKALTASVPAIALPQAHDIKDLGAHFRNLFSMPKAA